MDCSESGSICKQCGRRRPVVYTDNETGEYKVLECPCCSNITVNCHHCGTKLRAYKTNRDDAITVEKCYACIIASRKVRPSNL